MIIENLKFEIHS